MFHFNKKYFLLNVILFLVLVYIALFVKDQFVRPILGDVLVVGWLYLFLASFIKLPWYIVAHFVLFVAYAVEVVQYFNLITILGLQNIEAVRIIFGSTFDWFDIVAYTVGWVCILLVECYRFKLNPQSD